MTVMTAPATVVELDTVSESPLQSERRQTEEMLAMAQDRYGANSPTARVLRDHLLDVQRRIDYTAHLVGAPERQHSPMPLLLGVGAIALIAAMAMSSMLVFMMAGWN